MELRDIDDMVKSTTGTSKACATLMLSKWISLKGNETTIHALLEVLMSSRIGNPSLASRLEKVKELISQG